MVWLLQKEVRQFRIREEKLSNEIELLQSKLSKETLENSVLTERLIQVSIFKNLAQIIYRVHEFISYFLQPETKARLTFLRLS